MHTFMITLITSALFLKGKGPKLPKNSQQPSSAIPCHIQ